MVGLFESHYRHLLYDILEKGTKRESRTGNTLALFNQQLSADLSFNEFPLITGRKMFWKNIEGEAEWMLSGSSNINDLHKHDVHIWDQWADEQGELGPTYGVQLAKQWRPILDLIKAEPETRRAVINLWAAALIKHMALPPCYTQLQFYMYNDELSMIVTMRSSDAAVGLPYDVATCAYLLLKACKYTGYFRGQLHFNLADVHINEENLAAISTYLESTTYAAPQYRYKGDKIILHDYISSRHIPMVIKP